jgi:heme-degrading monooxygenase HmoA
MLANITTVRTDRGSLDEEAKMAAEALLPWVRQFDGYRGIVVLSDRENGTAHFVTFWEDEEALRRSAHGRQQVREQMAKTAGVDITSVQAYSVLLVDGF